MKVGEQKCYKQQLIDYEHIFATTQRGKNTDLFLNPFSNCVPILLASESKDSYGVYAPNPKSRDSPYIVSQTAISTVLKLLIFKNLSENEIYSKI